MVIQYKDLKVADLQAHARTRHTHTNTHTHTHTHTSVSKHKYRPMELNVAILGLNTGRIQIKPLITVNFLFLLKLALKNKEIK